MTKPNHDGASPIDKLLADRAQFVSWLTRLNSSGGAPPVPEAVRSRVRSDYERRLEAVLEELRGHTSALEGQVDGLEARASELTAREAEHKEHLAEAEVRHVVGEYDDGKWDGIRTELHKVLGQVHEELGQTRAEIARLTEVLDTIRNPAVPEHVEPEPEPEPVPPPPPLTASGPRPVVSTPPRPAPAPEPPPEPAAPPAGELPFRQPAAKAQPKAPSPPPPAKKDEPAGRTLWFPSGKPAEGGGKLDELAFLKSVTGHEAPAAPAPTPAPRSRASGGFTRAPDPPPAAEPPPEPKAAEPTRDRSSGSGQKTLKCAECGTLNRPTEWYCERCGAELAAL